MSAQYSRRSMCFLYGDERIYFDCIPRPQITDRVLIKVHPDCRVVVSAPEESDDQTVLNAVQKRRRWIYQQLRDFRHQLAYITPRKYISGESHYYLGKQYLLKVLIEPASAQGVKMLRGKLEVITHDRDAEKVRQLLINWYKARAKEVFTRRLDAMLEQTLWISEQPQLRLLTMQTQWGSCSPGGRLTLNPYLVKAPRDCIDYVILHELCHIAEHNHSERFYRLMGQVMPEWEGVKTRLDEMAGVIFSDL